MHSWLEYWVAVFALIIIGFLYSLNCNAQENNTNNTAAMPTIVKVGDDIRIDLHGETAFDKAFRVSRDGVIILPEAGKISVINIDEKKLSIRVKVALSRAFKNLDDLQVRVEKSHRLIKISGYVNAPGEILLNEGDDLQAAFVKAGGLRTGGQLDRMQLRRNTTTTTFNFKQYLDTGNRELLPQLQSLDEIFVPASPKTGNIEIKFDPKSLANGGDAAENHNAIKIFGEVRSPGSFSFNDNNSVVDYLMRAGGVTRYASVEQIRVISDGSPKLFNLKTYLETGSSSELPTIAKNTTIFVPIQEEEIKAGANMVYIMGEVFKPGAYEGKEGATFLDILANAGGPTRYAESRQIRLIRASGKVIPFDLAAFTESSTRQPLPDVLPGDAIFVPEKTDMNEKSWLKVAPSRAVRVIGEVVRPGRFEWSDEMSLLDLLAHAGGPTSRADTSRIEVVIPKTNKAPKKLTFNLDTFIEQGLSDSQLPQLKAGTTVRVHDLPQDPSDNKSQWVRQSSADSIYVFGQVNAPGRYRFTQQMHLLDILAAADGPSEKADISKIRINHRDQNKATVSELNLHLYFETGDENLLPTVKPGDTIYIPATNGLWLHEAKEQTVRVLGAINKPGRYRFDDNMTILDILAEAGGMSEEAHLKKITVINISCCKDQARIFNFIKFSKTANLDLLPVVRAGDTIFVPNRRESRMYKARESIRDVFQVISLFALAGVL